MNFQEFIAEPDLPMARETFNAVLSSKEPRRLEIRALRKDKSIIPIEITVCPVFKEGHPHRYPGHCQGYYGKKGGTGRI